MSTTGDEQFFRPVSGFDLPRFAGVPTFMRLPHVPLDHPRIGEVQVGLIGAPWDGGTTNRPGPRHGPRQLRDLSTMIRAENGVTGVRPFEALRCADLGDVGPNPGDLMDTLARMEAFYAEVRRRGILPLTAGGDHLCSLPILRALAKDRPLGMIHFDSHTDLFHSYFGGTMYTHGTPFRRAVEEGLLDPKRVCQIGIRGTAYDREDRDFAASVGIRIIPIEEFHARGVEDVMAEAREIAGAGETYVSYDIDFVDPAYAPGTGTPEVGGPTSWQALQVARLLQGVNIVGADLVEVSPPFDASGGTAFLGVSIMFEMLCVMAEAGDRA
ncbi:agmatinase [Cereibacter changlensis JA139]|uniref:Agmatinase n=2 Tax=Cereibacter changlensis TaxID=402884 RepID=A0A2T4JRZ7_9RHOB|nr:agmatinase [Cereibacter changlensis]PTE20656.1 agmatinase [Cereibacter changlensis JA139]PZX50076.1 guanidinopropionase [Cereibacter changlensis]